MCHSKGGNTMLNFDTFENMKPGEKGIVLALVEKVEEKTARNGSPYIKAELKDGETSKSVMKWQTSKKEWEQIAPENSVVMASIKCEEYNSCKSFTFGGINAYKAEQLELDPDATQSLISEGVYKLTGEDQKHYGISSMMFIPGANMHGDEIYQKIIDEIDKNIKLGKFGKIAEMTISILKRYKEKFIRYGAGISVHHAYPGGLAEHTYDVFSIVCECLKRPPYNTCNAEIALCGAALHDIGKCVGYVTNDAGLTDITFNGVMFDHSLEGVKIIEEEYASNPSKYSEDETRKVKLLEHVIASHHGKREYGAITVPSTLEAVLVSQADLMSSHFETAYETLKPIKSGEFAPRSKYLEGASMYKE